MAANMTGKHLILGISLMVLHIANASGEGLSDPTRPPAEIGEWTGTGGGMAGGAGGDVPSASYLIPNTKGLTSVIMSPSRCAAVIDGKMVKLGGTHGGMKLVEITTGSVVLERGKSRRTLYLYKGVGVTLTATGAVARQAAECNLSRQLNQKSEMNASGSAGQKEKK